MGLRYRSYPSYNPQALNHHYNKLMENRRICARYALVADVKICHPSFGEFFTTTTDASDSGIFIEVKDLKLPPSGSILTIQIINTPEELPIREVKITRVIKGRGAGLAYCDWGFDDD
ncbi:MAG: hypothetical protein DRQ62_14020 [Gammaproteobacteria bacterium]|nr:MAG: hypothetical protein DRQ62_14020 [Gammaproteobacteria bacterium]